MLYQLARARFLCQKPDAAGYSHTQGVKNIEKSILVKEADYRTST
jgi:hypothetical protein